MPRHNPRYAHEAREKLAAKYEREASSTEAMQKNAEDSGFSMVASNLKNIAQRKRTYAKTARRMNKE